MNNLVIFKGHTDGILVLLDNNTDFENIITALVRKLEENKNFFKNSDIVMKIKGRVLDMIQKEILLEILSAKNITQVSFIDFDELSDPIDNLNIKIVEEIIENKPNTIKYSNTCYWTGILRSGQEIISEGSAIIIGDVNPGAVIRAYENIIVLGNLNGRAFAGMNTIFENPYIIAYGMNPEQIGLGEFLATAPRETKKFVGLNAPEIAYLNSGVIHVDKIDIKLMQSMIQ
ncbi:hypothetical protein AN641_01390 [Candidatus Epulonipiscioides gigas]|nr:hypothetical protein AN641_01390 [Epulopiscium sp. SCG-C07WGA-EpuloA2]